jgi:arabinose-5-phosphate isomerase
MHGGDRNPVVSPVTPWLDVVSSVTRGGLGGVNVVNSDSVLAGIITDGDLRRVIQRVSSADLMGLSAEAFMTRNPVTVSPDELAYTALQLMEDRPSQISLLPVVDGSQRCVGLLRLHDLVRSGL